MRRTSRGFLVLVAILAAGCLAAGCGSAVQSAISSVTSRAAASSSTTATPSTPTESPSTPTTEPSTPTVEPSTATTTVTATPASSAAEPSTPAPTTSPTAAVSGSSSGTGLIWLWVLLGVLVLGGLISLIAWITRSGRRRSEAAAGWRSRLVDAYAKGSALHDAMSVAEMQGDLAASDASARWYEIQRRADDLAQTLYALREAASDPGDQARIADVLASLQAVRSAMDAERAPGGASMQQADVVRSRLSGFELSLRALRADDQGFS
jgi:hypothetical protein